MSLQFTNTLSRRKETFTPTDAKNVRMYVCGPTVYDRPHLGNARSVVVYDVLYRLLCHTYGKDHITYARNITDVDDKINAAAKENGEPISALTQRITQFFHDDMAALGCLRPNMEPRATEHIAQMIAMIEQLIAGGHAYEAAGHVYFDVESYAEYGHLSGRKIEELVAGARIEVEKNKKNPGDFVLWKPANAGDDASSVFDSPWGAGRPGWHIECSAMATHYLGDTFDIHGGGADLKFPHHENEIAQSCCSRKGSGFARFWVHNGFLTVNGEKMSKSLGNFFTVRELLDKGIKGEVIRLAFMSAKYNEPLDWNDKLIHDAQKMLDRWYNIISVIPAKAGIQLDGTMDPGLRRDDKVVEALSDDLNTPKAIATLHQIDDPETLKASANLLGLLQQSADEWFKGDGDDSLILAKIEARKQAKANKDYAEADRIRQELEADGILLEDKPGGITDWRRA